MSEPDSVWHQHRAVQRDRPWCVACEQAWPCRPVIRVLPALDRSGFFGR